MPSWITETAQYGRLIVGRTYSKRQTAEVIGVSLPSGSRDWGGLVRFSNAICLFITLRKGPDRYAREHQYEDRFDGDLLYWDSRASHDKSSSQVKAVRDVNAHVVAFARLGEKNQEGRTQPFTYLGSLDFVDWWGAKPVHFTWRLREFPNGLGGTEELDALAAWRPSDSSSEVAHQAKHRRKKGAIGPTSRKLNEGAKGRVTMNRYERDPRARTMCLKAHGRVCFICGFDFGVVYGRLGDGFIFVHHSVPVALRARTGSYELDPVRDLVPICGNCHAMVHRRVFDDEQQAAIPQLDTAAVRRLRKLRQLALEEEWEAID